MDSSTERRFRVSIRNHFVDWYRKGKGGKRKQRRGGG